MSDEVRKKVIENSEVEEVSDGVCVECVLCGAELSRSTDEPNYEAIERARHRPTCPMTALRVEYGLEFNPQRLKLFVYSCGEYDSFYSVGIFSRTRAESDRIAIEKLPKAYGLTECSVDEIEVDDGVVVNMC